MDSLASTGKLRRALSGPRSRELKGLDFLCNFWHRGDRSDNTEGDCALKKDIHLETITRIITFS